MLADRRRGAPPQIDALDGSEVLVTITIGGNDVGYIPLLMAAALPRLAGLERVCPHQKRKGHQCRDCTPQFGIANPASAAPISPSDTSLSIAVFAAEVVTIRAAQSC